MIGFEQPAHGDSVGWNRYLTLLGERAYFIGGACDTCAFIFERMGGANRNVSPEKTAGALRGGLERVDDTLVGAICKAVPEGNYLVSLLEHPQPGKTRRGGRLFRPRAGRIVGHRQVLGPTSQPKDRILPYPSCAFGEQQT